MKKIFKYFGILLSAALMGAFTACNPVENEFTADLDLGIKVFFPTKVVTGQPMTINGSGLSKVTEIVFPSGVTVSDFEVVSDEMLRVTAPAGISAEGGKIIVRTADDEAESRLPLTVGGTKISGYSKMPGESIKGNELLTVYGEDLEFITSAEFLDEDGNPLVVGHEDFYRKGTSTLIIIIPTKVFEGTFAGIIRTYDGREFTMDEFAYEPAKDLGHWEIVKNMIWENPDPDGIGAPSWDSKYRFGLEGNDANNECITTFPADLWSIIKEGTIRVAIRPTGAANVRITTGWWAGTYGGAEYNAAELIQEDADGNQFIELNIKEEGNIYGLIDEQHFLLTGSDYIPLAIYTQEEVWVEGEAGHWERNSIWKNDGSGGAISWNSTYRFGLEGNDGLGECIATFPADVWSIIKDGTFRVAFEPTDAANIRVTTGWWSAAYGGGEYNCAELMQEEEDGTKYIEFNIKEDGNIYGLIDEQHLLFTGSDYQIVEIYTVEWVEGGGGAAQETVFWENDGSKGEISWNGDYRFTVDGGDALGECLATFAPEVWDIIKTGTFYMQFSGDGAQIRITDGWWSTTWTGNDLFIGDERITDNGDGTFTVEINLSGDPLVDVLDAQHLLLTGAGYTPLKLFYK